MKALNFELNKLESFVTKSENEMQKRQIEVNKMDADMKVMNEELKKFLYEREANALIKRIDSTLQYIEFFSKIQSQKNNNKNKTIY